MKVIIADTSCLIIYDRINKLGILKSTFEGLIVTKEVAKEYGELPDWIKIRELEDEAQYLKCNYSAYNQIFHRPVLLNT